VFGAETLRVGVLQEAPIAFMTKSGRFHGFAVDVLQNIAKEQGWQVTYETGTETELLERLDGNQIDLLTNLAYTPEYGDRYRFTRQTLINNWGEIAVRNDSSADSLADLDGKRIGVVRSNRLEKALQDLLNRFGLESEVVVYASFEDVANAIVGSEVHAGALSRIFMLRNADQYKIKRAPVTFAPLEIRYAAARPPPVGVLDMIDASLAEGKRSGSSYYYASFDKWFPIDRSYKIPRHVVWSLYVVAALAIGILFGRGLQRTQARKRTRVLMEAGRQSKKEVSA
jgi:ABC-type amino acid transport substrate-binding protein